MEFKRSFLFILSCWTAELGAEKNADKKVLAVFLGLVQ
jgi:hypothetical protein